IIPHDWKELVTTVLECRTQLQWLHLFKKKPRPQKSNVGIVVYKFLRTSFLEK
ncbi:hypothetical protein STEG23_013673, partial [Scotinomys teguina]